MHGVNALEEVLTVLRVVLTFFGLYILLIGCCGLWTKKCPQNSPSQIRFAVIIPAHNEVRVIGNLLENLTARLRLGRMPGE